MARYLITPKQSTGSGMLLTGLEFQATTFANAQTCAQQLSTALQTSLVMTDTNAVNGLVNGVPGTYPFTPAAAGSALGNGGTGISF